MSKRAKRWAAAEASKILDRADRAKSDQAYAKSQGVGAHRLGWWRKRLDRPRRALGRRGARAEFVEVMSKPTATRANLEVLLANGRQFRISSDVDPKIVGRLADALDGKC